MISSTFFFLFSQLGVGMMLTLLFISPRSIGNSFFKFASLTAAILLGVTLGFNFLFPSPVRTTQLAGYFPRDLGVADRDLQPRRRHRQVHGRLLAFDRRDWRQASSLWRRTHSHFKRLMNLGGWENWVLLVNHLAATALLGSVMLTMVFGHWYLVIPRLSIDPLEAVDQSADGSDRHSHRHDSCIAGRSADSNRAFRSLRSLRELTIQQGIFFWPRVIFGVLVPIVLAAMIWSTVKIRHTQAATGLLYLAVVALLFGEFFSKFLLFAVNIPL